MTDESNKEVEGSKSKTSKPEKPSSKNSNTHSPSSPFGAADTTDGREKHDWESKYPEAALRVIRIEALVLSSLLFTSLVMLFLTWCGVLSTPLAECCSENATSAKTLEWFMYVCASGLMAGTIFSMKWLYHAVARGWWHIDRQLWRFMSPLISVGVAFVVAVLVQENLLNGAIASSNPSSAIAIGFLAGYFSDNAIAKMLEVANVIFGTATRSKS